MIHVKLHPIGLLGSAYLASATVTFQNLISQFWRHFCTSTSYFGLPRLLFTHSLLNIIPCRKYPAASKGPLSLIVISALRTGVLSLHVYLKIATGFQFGLLAKHCFGLYPRFSFVLAFRQEGTISQAGFLFGFVSLRSIELVCHQAYIAVDFLLEAFFEVEFSEFLLRATSMGVTNVANRFKTVSFVNLQKPPVLLAMRAYGRNPPFAISKYDPPHKKDDQPCKKENQSEQADRCENAHFSSVRHQGACFFKGRVSRNVAAEPCSAEPARYSRSSVSTTAWMCSSGVEAPAVTPTVAQPSNHAGSSSSGAST